MKLSQIHLHICNIIPPLFRLHTLCLLVFTGCLPFNKSTTVTGFLAVKKKLLQHNVCVIQDLVCVKQVMNTSLKAAYGVMWKEKSTHISNYSNTSESLWKERAPTQGNQTTHNLMRFKLLPRVKPKGNHVALAHFTAAMSNRRFPSRMMRV